MGVGTMAKASRVTAWVAILVAALIALLSSGGSAPRIHPQTATHACVVPAGKGYLGACSPTRPRRGVSQRPFAAGSTRICDVSNNDPINGSSWARLNIAGCYLKLNESTGFVDSTAGPMVSAARHFKPGVLLGGYDFQHVCGSNPVGEANVFMDRVIALGLDGPNTLIPMADTEYGSCGSFGQAVAWQNAWVGQVRAREQQAHLPVRLSAYTGEWYYGAHFPCSYWPFNDYPWISGYTGSLSSVPRVCGHPHISLWQYTDAGGNGANTSDMSVWVDNSQQFSQFANQVPADPFARFPVGPFHWNGLSLNEHDTVAHWFQLGCQNPVIRPECKVAWQHVSDLRDRVYWVAHNPLGRDGKPTWGFAGSCGTQTCYTRGVRFHRLSAIIGR